MKNVLMTFSIALLIGGTMQAQEMDYRDRLANTTNTSTLTTYQQNLTPYSVVILTMTNETLATFTTTDPTAAISSLQLPQGVFRVMILEDGVLVSERYVTNN